MRPKLLALATVLAVVVGVALIVAGAPVAAAPTHRAAACRPWRVHTVRRIGHDWLESLAFDGRGGLTLSDLAQGKILRLTPSGRLSTLVAELTGPGAEVVRGRFLYYTTGDIIPPQATGTIDRLDLRTGRNTVWARGLTMPNGLAFLPDGDAVVTRDLETGPPASDITLVPAHDRGHPRVAWARVPDGNGVAVDPSGRWLYSDRSFSRRGALVRIRIAHPRTVQVIGHLGPGSVPDDISAGAGGVLDIAAFGAGRVVRFDPTARSACTLARGLTSPTAAVAAGKGWPAGDLFVTSSAGFLYELSPPRNG
jgi:sugar lactone lactonase YvrE